MVIGCLIRFQWVPCHVNISRQRAGWPTGQSECDDVPVFFTYIAKKIKAHINAVIGFKTKGAFRQLNNRAQIVNTGRYTSLPPSERHRCKHSSHPPFFFTSPECILYRNGIMNEEHLNYIVLHHAPTDETVERMSRLFGSARHQMSELWRVRIG